MKLLKRLISSHPPDNTPLSKAELATHWSKPITITKMSEQASPTFYDPKPQPFYAFKKQDSWQKATSEAPTYSTFPPIKLLCWNIDFQAPQSQARMTRALEELHRLLSTLPSTTHIVILLQEMTASDLTIIQSTPWVQQDFHMTETTHHNWLSHYGTLSLIDIRLHIASVFRVNYASDMGRDALFVDIEDATPTTLRICNTHLESLASDPPLRPAQVKLAARYMKDPTVDGAVIAGDFNAIQDFDRSLHTENGLKDAYLEGGGKEDDYEGWTWGRQNLHEGQKRFPPSRMDKVLYCGGLRVEKLERIGDGVMVGKVGRGDYVTDHLGLMVDVVVEEEL